MRSIALARPWPTKVKVRAENLDLATLPGLPENGRYEGQLRATVEASGDLGRAREGQATATIDSFAGSWNGQPFSVKSPSRLRYADERLDIERLEVAASDSVLTVSGELPLTDRAGAGEIAIELQGNLATLAQYLPPDTPVTGDGAVTLTGTLKGTLKAIDPDLVAHRRQRPGPVAAARAWPLEHPAAGAGRQRRRERRDADGELGHGDARRVGPHPARGRSAAAGRDSAHGRPGDVQGVGRGPRPGGDSRRASRR